jgi:3-oxoacyl-[acyl-carrier-protein] synthase-3
MNTAVIKAIASYLPERVLTNQDLEHMVETSDEWILTRTGIRERRIATPEEAASDLGIKAAQRLLTSTGLDPENIDLVIVTTMTPDYIGCPATAPIIQSAIGAKRAAAFDLMAACSGFIYGLATAKAFLESGLYSTILLVSSEKNSAFTDYTDRNTCVLFGDGASATLLQRGGPGLQVRSCNLGASGSEASLICIPAGGSRKPPSLETIQEKEHTIKMNGREVFKHAVRKMEESILLCLESEKLSQEQIRWLIPHQANFRIMEAVAKRFNIDTDRLVVTIDSYANTSSSTIPIALDLLLQQKRIQPDDIIALTAVGGGLTWGSAILKAV